MSGVTPELFYGTYTPGGGSGLAYHEGLADCVSVYGSTTQVDVNTAPAAVLAAVGLDPGAVQAVVARRGQSPFQQGEIGGFVQSVGGSTDRLRVEGNSIVTFRSTARLRLANGQPSDLRRTVAAQVKYMAKGSEFPYYTLRWFDTAWSH